MSASERQEAVQHFVSGDTRAAARNRRSQRGPEPPPPMPAGDQSRTAVDAGSPGAAHRTGGTAGTDEARSRRAPARGRHVRRGIRSSVLLARMRRVAGVLGSMRGDCVRARDRGRRDRPAPDGPGGRPPRTAAERHRRRRSPGSRYRRGRPGGAAAWSGRRARPGAFRWAALRHDAQAPTLRADQPVGLSVDARGSAASTSCGRRQSGFETRWRSPGRAHDAIRRRIDSLSSTTDSSLDSIADRLLSAFLTAFQPAHELAGERERAIAEALRQQRARLATSLLQPGLFDRRVERVAAAQNATLDEALDRCARRLDELARCSSVSIDRRLALRSRLAMIPGVRGSLISSAFARDVLPAMPESAPVPAADRGRRSRRGRCASSSTLGIASSVRAITDVAILPLLDLLGLAIDRRIDERERCVLHVSAGVDDRRRHRLPDGASRSIALAILGDSRDRRRCAVVSVQQRARGQAGRRPTNLVA